VAAHYLQNVSAGGALKGHVMAVPVTTTPTSSAGTPHMLFEGPFRIDGGHFRNYDVTPDGQRFLMVREVERPPARVSQVVLVHNWVEELKSRVPAGKGGGPGRHEMDRAFGGAAPLEP
jgi:hypothetical protein